MEIKRIKLEIKRVVKHRNRLPREAVETSSLEIVKSGLDRHLTRLI